MKYKTEVLGKNVKSLNKYDPTILEAIPRGKTTTKIALFGFDNFYCFDFMFCNDIGQSQAYILEISYSRASRFIVESKSLKLYLHGLYYSPMSVRQLNKTIKIDLENIVGELVTIRFLPADEKVKNYSYLALEAQIGLIDKASALAQISPVVLNNNCPQNESIYFSNLFRSLCPVTGQPDWATIVLSGKILPSPENWLAYILQFSELQDFHESVIDTMAKSLVIAGCKNFGVTGLFQRRGGISINPFRSDNKDIEPVIYRTNRQ